ncbi:Ger(x)C family spore germination protein [Paenibacillus elgii]|uniref:Ger(x)C family spore germination protein n=1 Tax=Paenibacillus elgii TaxID=189691 RepID=UPI000248C9E4|nr:Ger(x)C family spore germination protein [Paenibacillus elgii]
MRRGLIVLLATITALLMNGCWNRKELNELGIVIATAIDIGANNQWELSFQVVIPQSIATQSGGGGGNQAPVTVFTTKGKTLEEAFRNASNETSRSLFLAHNRVIILSEQVAKNGVNQVVDFYLRQSESRETMDVFLTRGNSKKLLRVLIPLEKIPGNAIDKMIQKGELGLSTIRKINLHEFISTAADPSASAILPEIKISGEPGGQSSLEALKKPRSSAVIKLGDIGVFKKDKLVGWLKREESIGLAWLSNHIHSTVVVFPCAVDDRNSRISSFRVENGATSLKPKITNGILKMTVDIKASGTLNEMTCRSNLKNPEKIKELEAKIQEQIKSDVKQTFDKAKKMHADTFGFGEIFHKKYPREWKKMSGSWSRTFKEIKLEVTVKVNIRRTGLINDPISKFIKI